jgi:molybdopterin molybdotransferase
MAEVPYFISLEEALLITKNVELDIESEVVNLDNAHGRILAQPLSAKVDDPPFDNSAMDGYAVLHSDTINPPTKLKVSAVVQASSNTTLPTLISGNAIQIMTGAPIPPGADAIIPIEHCEVKAESIILQIEGKRHFIRKQGENLKIGKEALGQGSLLTPSKVGLCATMGHWQIKVQKPLKIAIISTGDELKSPGEELLPGEIYESNAFGLSGLVKMMGHKAIRYPMVEDNLEGLRKSLDIAAKECDLILTSGGVSMGEWDLVRKIMEEEGKIKFWRVKIRPGSPPLFGKWRDTPIFGLPGNPVSSHVVFRMLVAPWLLHVTGADGPTPIITKAKLMDPVKSTTDCLTLRRVTITSAENGLEARQPRHQGSGNIESLASADALTLLKPGQSGKIGEIIDVVLL